MRMKKVVNYLKKLGITERQSEVYLGLLEHGPKTVQELAQVINMQRPTVHKEVEELMTKGLVYQTKKGTRRRVAAEEPDRLIDIVDEHIAQSQRLKEDLNGIINMVNTIKADIQKNPGFDFRYYEGEQAVLNLYKETLVGDENYSFVNLDKYYEIYPESESQFTGSYDKNPNRRVWDIAVDSVFSRQILKRTIDRYKAKFISSPNLAFGFDIQIYDNKVALIQLEKGSVAALVIESEMIHTIMKTLHKTMWEKLQDEGPR